MPPTAATCIEYRGYANIVVGCILAVCPQVIYNSFIVKSIALHNRLRLSNARTAPGFNHAIACMVIAIGVAHVFAARSGPAARASIFAMDVTWAALALLTCLATPRAWKLGSATLMLSGYDYALFSAVIWLLEPALLRGSTRRTR
ncbi:hypothetical protein FPV67DRAFT_1665167 [Lyophyllum atratum]|nr:hypothetical protein FPV67DRAFT_1665167 [Lyophyllum atratum]